MPLATNNFCCHFVYGWHNSDASSGIFVFHPIFSSLTIQQSLPVCLGSLCCLNDILNDSRPLPLALLPFYKFSVKSFRYVKLHSIIMWRCQSKQIWLDFILNDQETSTCYFFVAILPLFLWLVIYFVMQLDPTYSREFLLMTHLVALDATSTTVKKGFRICMIDGSGCFKNPSNKSNFWPNLHLSFFNFYRVW